MDIKVPTTKIDGETWLILHSVLGKKVVFRAADIRNKGQVKDPSDHRVFEAHAEGGVKCRSKQYDITGLLL